MIRKKSVIRNIAVFQREIKGPDFYVLVLKFFKLLACQTGYDSVFISFSDAPWNCLNLLNRLVLLVLLSPNLLLQYFGEVLNFLRLLTLSCCWSSVKCFSRSRIWDADRFDNFCSMVILRDSFARSLKWFWYSIDILWYWYGSLPPRFTENVMAPTQNVNIISMSISCIFLVKFFCMDFYLWM